MTVSALPRLTARHYMQPLREGGSLPAVVDTSDGMYVVKFRGAGQGAGALVAELLAGGLAGAIGLPVPGLSLVDVAPEFARGEPDPEIQDLLRASHGTNVGLRYLDGAFNFDGYAAGDLITPELAAEIVWFDALVTNPDRTHRNTNLLVWQRTPWLIDHGSTVYAHHDWSGTDEQRARTPFPLIRNHVLLASAADIADADERMVPRLNGVVADVIATLPGELLLDGAFGRQLESAAAARAKYRWYLAQRMREPRAWVAEARSAQAHVRAHPPQRKTARR